jgi:fido (protein-threonine AMPylation protein)
MDLGASFDRFDGMLDHGEQNDPAGSARRAMIAPTPQALLEVHRLLFSGQPGCGTLRTSPIAGPFPGQDCPEPEYIAKSLENLEVWLSAESFAEMHPIEQAALALTRILDIWPFRFGNRTTAVVFANHFLARAGYPPFFVLPDQLEEFEQILAQAIRMQTEPLVRAMYKCMEREIDLVGS